MSNQPIVMNIMYTPYSLPKNAMKQQRMDNARERAFYDMTGETNIYKYMTTEEKQEGESKEKKDPFTVYDYFKRTVFNDKGIIKDDELAEMKERAKNNKGNIWHGYISLNQEESYKIDTPEKSIELVKKTFPQFFKDAKLKADNIDLMCALHKDRPHHYHVHFCFWEKEAKYRDRVGNLSYRRKGRIDKLAIAQFKVRLGLFLDDEKDNLPKSRDEAYKALREVTGAKVAMSSTDEIRKEILALAKALPEEGRLSYGSKDMEPYRDRVDKIVKLLLQYDRKACKADLKFYRALEERQREIENICGQPFAVVSGDVSPEDVENNYPKYHFKIDPKVIKIVSDIEADYKKRQGNLVINLARFIKPEYYERKPGKEYKSNDKTLKRSLTVSKNKISAKLNSFLSSFFNESNMLERDFTHRLQEIEEEIERERERKNKQGQGDYKD